jgi:hypothetical protein
MALTAESIRNKIPIPKFPHPVIGWLLFFAAAIVLYDSYDGRGKQGPYPVSTIFPW